MLRYPECISKIKTDNIYQDRSSTQKDAFEHKKTFNHNGENYKIVCLDAIYTACVDERSYL